MARAAYPKLRFTEGSMTALELGDDSSAASWPGTRPSHAPGATAGGVHRVPPRPRARRLSAARLPSPRRPLGARRVLRPQGGARLPLVPRPRLRPAEQDGLHRDGPPTTSSPAGGQTPLPAGSLAAQQGLTSVPRQGRGELRTSPQQPAQNPPAQAGPHPADPGNTGRAHPGGSGGGPGRRGPSTARISTCVGA